MIISPKKLIKMARKWQQIASIGKKRLPLLRKGDELSTSGERSSEVAEKGHFVIYTTDKRRFSFPIGYLNSLIFRELFRMSEEEFGLPNDGPIMLPYDSEFMSYVKSLMHKKAAKDVEKALLMSIAACRCSSSSSSYDYLHNKHEIGQHMLLCGY